MRTSFKLMEQRIIYEEKQVIYIFFLFFLFADRKYRLRMSYFQCPVAIVYYVSQTF